MKFKSILISLMLFCKIAYAQEPNVFNAEPDELKLFLQKKYKKIEVEIVKFRGKGSERARMPGKSAFKNFEFQGDTFLSVIYISKEDETDTIFYKYDNCGKIVLKKAHSIHNKYSNRYKNCKLLSREINETEIDPSGINHTWNLIRYVYDKAGRLEKELVYDFYDTANMLFSNEYFYKGNLTDSIKEYYFDEDGVKMLNRMTRYFYSSKLDSINYYNSLSEVIDKKEFQYMPDGKIGEIRVAGVGICKYYYNTGNELQMVTEERENKDYIIKLFE